MKTDKNDNLFSKDDPFDDPLWKDAEKNTHKNKATRSEEHIGCKLEWLKQVSPHIKNKNQLIVMLIIYRLTVLRRSRTVSLANGELEELGVSRYTKSRALKSLKCAKLIKTAYENGRAVMVTLLK